MILKPYLDAEGKPRVGTVLVGTDGLVAVTGCHEQCLGILLCVRSSDPLGMATGGIHLEPTEALQVAEALAKIARELIG